MFRAKSYIVIFDYYKLSLLNVHKVYTPLVYNVPLNNILANGEIKSLTQRMGYSTLRDTNLAHQSSLVELNNNTKDISHIDSIFLQWFVGFTDAEGSKAPALQLRFASNFIINSLKNTKLVGTPTKFTFMFKIALHNLKTLRVPGLIKSLGCNHATQTRSRLLKDTHLLSSINKRPYSTISDPSSLNPQWVTGFVDAEGSFMIRVRSYTGATGWRSSVLFSIHLHAVDLQLL